MRDAKIKALKIGIRSLSLIGVMAKPLTMQRNDYSINKMFSRHKL